MKQTRSVSNGPKPHLILAVSHAMAALILGVAACGGGSSTGTQPSPSLPPTRMQSGAIIQTPRGIGLASATAFSFSTLGFWSSDGGELSYTWDFGDDSRLATGANVTHQYQQTGEFEVRVTATNPAGQSVTASPTRVSVGSVTGSWIGFFPIVSNGPIPFNLQQIGKNLSGTGTYGSTTTVVTGTVAHPVTMNLEVTVQPGPGVVTRPYTFYISGTGNPSLDTFDATLTGFSICPCSGTVTRR